jgi:O-acetylserine/cysteine efflux transporter
VSTCPMTGLPRGARERLVASGAALLLPFVGRPTRRELGPIIAISVFIGGLNFALFFVGLGRGLASVSSVANQLSTPFTILLARPILRERPSIHVTVGVALAFAGVALTVAGPNALVTLAPTLLVVGAGFALAVGNVLTKRYGPFEPLKLMAWMSLFTVPQILAISAVLELGQLASLHTATAVALMAFAYTVLFGAVAGFGLWFWLIAECSMTRVAPSALLQTVFAIAAGVIFLHGPLTVPLVAGPSSASLASPSVRAGPSRVAARRSRPAQPLKDL